MAKGRAPGTARGMTRGQRGFVKRYGAGVARQAQTRAQRAAVRAVR